MKYMGSKSRIAKEIVPIIQHYVDEYKPLCYLEPFVGGANIIDKIKYKYKIGSDANKYLIGLLKHVQKDGELLPEVSKELWNEVKSHPERFDDWKVGNVCFLASYNGRGFSGGYANKGIEHTSHGNVLRDYYAEAKRNLLNQAVNLKECTFECWDYKTLNPMNCVVYCDPPYIKTKSYDVRLFNTVEFWEIMRCWSKNNIVLISEQTAPDDFEVIFEKKVHRTLGQNRPIVTEKLFKLTEGVKDGVERLQSDS